MGDGKCPLAINLWAPPPPPPIDNLLGDKSVSVGE